jgi:hypothetical protein
MKAAEYLYELDRKSGGVHGFAAKPVAAPPKSDSGTKTNSRPKPDPKVKKGPARASAVAEVREQIRQQIVNAAPALLAANPTLLQRAKESPDGPP